MEGYLGVLEDRLAKLKAMVDLHHTILAEPLAEKAKYDAEDAAAKRDKNDDAAKRDKNDDAAKLPPAGFIPPEHA